jgi:predicted alpha/beta-fold hydrolase
MRASLSLDILKLQRAQEAATFTTGHVPSIPADISRIVKYAPGKLIGREAETKLLDDAWATVQNNETERPHILTFVALGGEGKTSLVAKWAAKLEHQNWPGCEAAFIL